MDRFGEVPKYLPLMVNGKDSDIVAEGKQIAAYLDYIKNEL